MCKNTINYIMKYMQINKTISLIAIISILLGLFIGFMVTRTSTPPQVNISIDTEESRRKISEAQNNTEYHKAELFSARNEIEKFKNMADEASSACNKLQLRNRDLEEELQNIQQVQKDTTKNRELAPGYNKCIDNSDGNIGKMAQCNEDAADYIDKKLLTVYRNVLKSCDNAGSPEECRAEVKKMELAWIRYVDMMSGFIYRGSVYGTSLGLSMNRIDAGMWRAQAKKDQLELLEAFLEE